MNKESQEAIKKVFSSFDKDGSGFIDIREIKSIAKELGQDMSEEESKKVKYNRKRKLIRIYIL
jgi:Ca2+-binding EF-hand superfamily protein